MEVHHPHHPTHKKKWSEYIIEFLMLFAAVTLGFFAENIREHQIVLHQTESVIAQLYHELQKDTANLHKIGLVHKKQDTATIVLENYILNTDLEANKVNFFYLHNNLCLREGMFETNCIALDQLKFGGILKNVKDNKLRDCIEKYNLSLLRIKDRSERQEDFMNRYIDDIRIAPFDYYFRTARGSSDSFINVKGDIKSSALITYRNKTWDFVMNKTFIPDKFTLKVFDKSIYLNRMLQLNGIRMYKYMFEENDVYKAGIELLQNIKRVYPDINEAH